MTGAEATHHAVLGLQLDLQGIDRASQLDDLRLATLQLLRAGHHLLVQLLGLRAQSMVRPSEATLKGNPLPRELVPAPPPPPHPSPAAPAPPGC